MAAPPQTAYGARYRYEPLPPDQGPSSPWTRIVDLLPGNSHDPLCCMLQNVDLSTFTGYFEALSYVWGTAMSPNPLHCSNGPLKITRNLEQALLALRLPNQTRRLWVDAIAIDQENLAERARQVGYMRQVYGYASRVVLWLGPRDAVVERAVADAEEIFAIAQPQLPGREGQGGAEVFDRERYNDFMIDVGIHFNKTSQAKNLCQFFSNDYFQRVWCMQEVVASKDCVAKAGDLEVDIFNLLVFAALIAAWQDDSSPFHPIKLWERVYLSRFEHPPNAQGVPKGQVGTMDDCLRMLRNAQSTDPRDHIFAILGITQDGTELDLSKSDCLPYAQVNHNAITKQLVKFLKSLNSKTGAKKHPAITPSYTKSVRDVFRDFTRYHVRRPPRMLQILSHVQHYSDLFEDGFPSWVPNFHKTQIFAYFVPSNFHAGFFQGTQRYLSGIQDQNVFGQSKEPDLLKLDGFRVDIVEAVTDILQNRNLSHEVLLSLWDQLFDVPLFPRPASLTSSSKNKDAADVSFFMALVSGGSAAYALVLLGCSPENDESAQMIMNDCAKACWLSWLENLPAADGCQYPDLAEAAARVPSHLVTPDAAIAVGMWVSNQRKLYRTRGGRVGIGSHLVQPGDHIVALFGGELPFVLRPMENEWALVGDSYIHDEELLSGRWATEVKLGSLKSAYEYFVIR